MPRYDLNIAIFDTIRYIVPSLVFYGLTLHQLLFCNMRQGKSPNRYSVLCWRPV